MSTLERPSTTRGTTEGAAASPSETAAPGPGTRVELEDWEFKRTLTYGAVLGAPLLFVVLMVVAWLAEVLTAKAVLAVLLPTLFSGPFFGGVAVLAVLERRAARQDRQQELD